MITAENCLRARTENLAATAVGTVQAAVPGTAVLQAVPPGTAVLQAVQPAVPVTVVQALVQAKVPGTAVQAKVPGTAVPAVPAMLARERARTVSQSLQVAAGILAPVAMAVQAVAPLVAALMVWWL